MNVRDIRRGDRPSYRGEAVRVALLYGAITFVLVYPLTIHPATTAFVLGGDTALYLWTLGWDLHALVHQPFALFDANIFYPFTHTLAYSENAIGSALIAAPFLWMSGSLVFAMNAVALLSVVLCGVGAYLLARRIGLASSSAMIAGLIYAFSPPRFFRIGQLHLTTVQWIPFSLAFLHAYLDFGERRDLWWACAFFGLQALTSGHGAVFLAVSAGLLVIWRIALGEPLRPVKRIRDLGLPGGLLIGIGSVLFLPYRTVQIEVGLRRTLEDAYDFAPVAASYLASTTHVHAFLLSALTDAPILRNANALLFFGYLPILLAGVALWPAARVSHRAARDTTFYGLLAVLSLWLSIGPAGGLYRLVYSWPGFNFIRVSSRYTILTALALGVVAAAGFERWTIRCTPAKRRMLAVLAGALLVGEFAAFPLAPEPYPPEIPAVDRWLASQPKPFVIAEFPVQERWLPHYMLHSTVHWQKTIEGYSGMRPGFHDALYKELARFPDQKTLATLADLGVNYLVVHSELYPASEWVGVRGRLDDFMDWLKLEHAEGSGRVYSLHRPLSAPP